MMSHSECVVFFERVLYIMWYTMFLYISHVLFYVVCHFRLHHKFIDDEQE